MYEVRDFPLYRPVLFKISQTSRITVVVLYIGHMQGRKEIPGGRAHPQRQT